MTNLAVLIAACLLSSVFVSTATRLSRFKRGLSHAGVKPWTDGVVPFEVDNSFQAADIEVIKRAMQTLSDYVCVKFVKYSWRKHSNWLHIGYGHRCYSEIGMKSGRQELILAHSCRSYGTILHELVHTLGLLHEMMRPDRNRYIRVHEQNLQETAKAGFNIDRRHVKYLTTSFDFQSVMLYSPYAFSKNGKPVWTKVNTSDKTPVYEVYMKELSFLDAKALNYLYRCEDQCPFTLCDADETVSKDCYCINAKEYARQHCHDNADYHDYCKGKAITEGHCYSKAYKTIPICRKSCGKCFQHGNVGVEKEPHRVCLNTAQENDCNRKKREGYCFFDLWTLANCQKACNSCHSFHNEDMATDSSSTCKDRSNSYLCQAWAQRGQCDENAAFMQSKCANSCGLCSSQTGVNPAAKPCRNYSPDSHCDAIFRENKCSGTDLKLCLGSCGKCGLVYERNEPLSVTSRTTITTKQPSESDEKSSQSNCVDMLPECGQWKKEGNCETYPENMKYHCPKACNFCHKRDEASIINTHQLSCADIDSKVVCQDILRRRWCGRHHSLTERCLETCDACASRKINK